MRIDPQEALRDAMTIVLRDSFTEPKTIEELGRIFGLGFRSMKRHLETIEHLKVGTMVRMPLHAMPSHWLANSLPILAESCVTPHLSNDP